MVYIEDMTLDKKLNSFRCTDPASVAFPRSGGSAGRIGAHKRPKLLSQDIQRSDKATAQ